MVGRGSRSAQPRQRSPCREAATPASSFPLAGSPVFSLPYTERVGAPSISLPYLNTLPLRRCVKLHQIIFPTSYPEMIRSCVKTSLRLLTQRNHHSNASSFVWEKPYSGWIKLNFDGASKCKFSNASIGGVCRDHEGLFMLGYAECIGRATSSVAELAACKRGLELALQNGWHSIWVEGDAKTVVDVFMNEVRLKSKEDLRIVREIRVLIPQLNDFSVSHIYRQGNRVAHEFAKLGYRYQKPQIWRNNPPMKYSDFFAMMLKLKSLFLRNRFL